MAKTKNVKFIKPVKKLKAKTGKASSAKEQAASQSKKAIKTRPAKTSAIKIAVPAPKKVSRNSTVKEDKVKTNKKLKNNISHREEKIHKIRITLLHQREALLNEAESALNELPGQTTFPDLGDQATAETDRNFMLRLRGREQRLLKKIDEAIDRIESGVFGICDDCGNEIDIKRLEARPVTTMCIECKTLQEEEEKLREA